MDEDRPRAASVMRLPRHVAGSQGRRAAPSRAHVRSNFFRERAPPRDLLPLKLMLSGPIVIAWSKLSALSCAYATVSVSLYLNSVGIGNTFVDKPVQW